MEGTLTCVCQNVTEKTEIVLICPEFQNLTLAMRHGAPKVSALMQLQHIVASLGNITFKINSKNIILIQYSNGNDIHSCDRPYFAGDFKTSTLYWRFKWSQYVYKRSNFVSIRAAVSSTDHPFLLPPLEFVNTKLNVDFLQFLQDCCSGTFQNLKQKDSYDDEVFSVTFIKLELNLIKLTSNSCF